MFNSKLSGLQFGVKHRYTLHYEIREHAREIYISMYSRTGQHHLDLEDLEDKNLHQKVFSQCTPGTHQKS